MHGGDVYRNKIDLDFSVNINPLGMPKETIKLMDECYEELSRYPDISCEGLKKKIGEYHGVAPEKIVCGNGASELIHGICMMARSQKALLNAPSFSGYERSLNALGTRIYYNYLNSAEEFEVSESFTDKIGAIHPKLVFITNPNNPDGNLVRDEERIKILAACRQEASFLVADECFIEMTMEGEEASFLRDIRDDDRTIILRAFTKTYGMPGLRLAYGICSDEAIAERLEDFLPEWNISSIAQKIGEGVIGDREYLKKSREYVKKERDFLSEGLTKLGMKVYHSDANFILFENDENDEQNLYEELLKRKILIRDCSDYMGLKKGHYRIAVKDHDSNEKLLKIMGEIIHYGN